MCASKAKKIQNKTAAAHLIRSRVNKLVLSADKRELFDVKVIFDTVVSTTATDCFLTRHPMK